MLSPKALVLVVLVAVLAGCSAAPSHVKPPPQLRTSPVFKTDAEALAAATKAYANYLKIEDKFASGGGVNVSLFDSIVTKSWMRIEKRSGRELVEAKQRQTGTTRFSRMRLESRSEHRGLAEISTYACLDVSDLAYVSIHNKLHVQVSGASVVPVEVRFKSSPAKPKRLLLDWNKLWAGTDFCQ